MKIETKSVAWDHEMNLDGSVPANDPALFPHYLFAKQKLSHSIFYPGRQITIRHKSTIMRSKVEVVSGRNLLVEHLQGTEWIDLSCVVPDLEFEENGTENSLINRTHGNSCDSPSKPSNDLLTAEDIVIANRSPLELIEVGQYLEIQDHSDPSIVRIGCITENRGGLLTIRSGSTEEILFLTCERLHEVGWLQKGEQSCTYTDINHSKLEKARRNSISPHVFTFAKIKPHKFQVGMMLEVLDPSNGGVFYPGYVSEVLNSHYFRVQISKSVSNNSLEILCCMPNSYIFPVFWCQRHLLRLSTPEDFGSEEFSWNAYQKKCGIMGGNAPENLFEMPHAHKFEKMRNVEVLSINDRGILLPGKIIRSMCHLIWIHLCHYNNATPPIVVSVRSDELFPCGYAEEHGIDLEHPAKYVGIDESGSNELSTLRKSCTSKVTSVFVPDRKRFLPRIIFNKQLWTPCIYVRKKCFCGPFIHPDKFCLIPDRYMPGSLPGIIRLIISDLIKSAYKPKDVCELLACAKDSILPQINIKMRVGTKRYRLNIECCERTVELPGWLRAVCMVLDACPDLFNIKNDSCESFCNLLKDTPTMNFKKHAWTSRQKHVVQRNIRRVRRIFPTQRNGITIFAKRSQKAVVEINEEVERPATRATAQFELQQENPLKMEVDEVNSISSSENLPQKKDNEEGNGDEINPKIGSIFDLPEIKSNPITWSTSELSVWIKKTEIFAIADALEREEIDGEAFMLLTINDCIDHLKLKLGPALKLNALVRMALLMAKVSSFGGLRRHLASNLQIYLRTPPSTSAAKLGWLMLSQRSFHNQSNVPPSPQNGYFTVFPIVPDATPENNKFVASIFTSQDWPAISLTPSEMYEGTVRMFFEYGASMQEHMDALATLKPDEISFENVVEPFIGDEQEVLYAFHTLWARMITDWPSSDELQIDFHRLQELAVSEITSKYRNAAFCNAIKVLCDNKGLTKWQKRLVDFYYVEMKSMAMYESVKKQEQVAGHDSFIEHSILRYRLNLNETVGTLEFNERSKFKDAPPSLLKLFAVNKDDYEKGPWNVRLSVRNLLPFLQYCDDKQMRSTAWNSWTSRAARSSTARSASNAKTIEILRRHAVKKATLMGFSTYSEYRLAYKMAESPEIVRKLIKALGKRLRPLFDDRMETWSSFAAENDKVYTLSASDLYYYCRKEAEASFEIDPLSLMHFYPFQPTFENLLEILSYIFNLKFKVKLQDVTGTNLERCHTDVRIYSVEDTSTGVHLGRIYVDPFRRNNKCCGWDVLLGRTPNDERKWDRIVYMVASLNGTSDSPSLLHYNDLQNLLFHTGRALQFLLSQSPYRDISIPWNYSQSHDTDAQDLLPNFVQLFAFKPMLLNALSSKHLVTGQSMNEGKSNDIALGLSRANFHETYRALFWADFDLTLFDVKDGDRPTWRDVYAEKCKEYFPFKQSSTDIYPCSFAPIFGRSTTMGMYYTRLWCEMLALDIHDTFDREDDVCSTGERFKRTILYEGAGEPQRELYRRFQGRDPSPDAMCDFYDPPSHYHLGAAECEAKAAIAEEPSITQVTEKLDG